MAALREVPFGLYYGSVDSTPLFVLLAGLYAERTGDDETLRELWPAIEAALAWIDGPGDPDGDGFVEYYRKTEQGLANQGWKDSHDAIFHADGTHGRRRRSRWPRCRATSSPPKQIAARCARRLGHARAGATSSKRRPSGSPSASRPRSGARRSSTYALALDGAKQPCRGAHLECRTGAVHRHRAAGSRRAGRAKVCCSPRFFSGWGIRTVARGEARYNPMSYHNGSIWPHDNALIALGLRALRAQVARSHRCRKGLFDAATYMDLRRLPELFCGFQRERGRGPTLYPVACSPQAWASATPFSLIEASLGLEFDPRRKAKSACATRSCRRSSTRSSLRNLQLGDSRIDLKVRRHGDEVSLELLRTRGKVQVSVVFSRLSGKFARGRNRSRRVAGCSHDPDTIGRSAMRRERIIVAAIAACGHRRGRRERANSTPERRTAPAAQAERRNRRSLGHGARHPRGAGHSRPGGAQQGGREHGPHRRRHRRSRADRVRAAIIDFGGFLGVGSRKIAVDWNALRFVADGDKRDVVKLELTRDQVKTAPEYKEKRAVIVLGAAGALQPMPYE